jgi:hypothetical protein
VLAPMLAVPFVLTDIGLPESLIKSLSLMGEVASGAALFLTGLILSAQKVRLGASIASQTLLANIVHPLIAAGLARLFAAPALTVREATVLSALPTGFFGTLFRAALRHVVGGTGHNADRVHDIERRDPRPCNLLYDRHWAAVMHGARSSGGTTSTGADRYG